MDDKDKRMISEILTYQDQQVKADITSLIINGLDEQQAREKIEKVVEKNIDSFFNSEDKRSEELRKYTESFRGAIEKERKLRIEEIKRQEVVKKAISLYEKQNLYSIASKQSKKSENESFLERIQKILQSIIKGNEPKKSEIKIPTSSKEERKESFKNGLKVDVKKSTLNTQSKNNLEERAR